jgi:argininosuccinate lyase
MTLWGGRFSGKMDPGAWALNASIGFDIRLAPQDLRGSQAWAQALNKVGVLTDQEYRVICDGLEAISREFKCGSFQLSPEDEDIHTAIERRLSELIGSPAGKLHTGRSRNDQVATAFRLWLMDHLLDLDQVLRRYQQVLVQRAEQDFGIIMPGYTHLQRAQPILLSHWWLAHFWPVHKDRQRLNDLSVRLRVSPLGSGALAGTPLPIDRIALAHELGFDTASPNSLEAVSDRDFAAEFLFCTALTGTHLSRFAEAVILFTSQEFGYFELSDAFATGSSLMPQKKNPDVFELARGKSGTLAGALVGFLTTLKGLPSAYDKDLQEDKIPVFNAYDTLTSLLPVLTNAVAAIKIYPEKMRSGVDATMLATDLADYLVLKGIPFRQAHVLAGKAVRRASELQVDLSKMSVDVYQQISPAFDRDVYFVFDLDQSIDRRSARGGTARGAVWAQLEEAKACL